MDSGLEVFNSLLWVVVAFAVFWISMWVGKMNEHEKNVEAFMKEMRRNIRNIRKEIDNIHKGGNTRG